LFFLIIHIVNYHRELFKKPNMKRPLYNMHERWEMQHDTTITALRKLNLAVLDLRRQIDRELTKLFKL